MMVWYVIKLRKQLVYFNWISTASFVALNKRGVKKRVSTPLMAIQIDAASVYKVSCFTA